jgi:CheY-like chemotaxis protein
MKTHFPILAATEARKNELIVGAERRGPTVLLVGEGSKATHPLAKILTHFGFSVMTVPDGKDALEIAALIPPELLIADGTIEGVRWLALTIAMKHAVPDCDVLLLSEPEWPAELIESVCLAGNSFGSVHNRKPQLVARDFGKKASTYPAARTGKIAS